jgi:hypothetical protein
MTSTQAQVPFHAALEDQGLLEAATGVLLGPDGRPLDRADDGPPILVAWSDIQRPGDDSRDTREFMALMAIRVLPSAGRSRAGRRSCPDSTCEERPMGVRQPGAPRDGCPRVAGEILSFPTGRCTPTRNH